MEQVTVTRAEYITFTMTLMFASHAPEFCSIDFLFVRQFAQGSINGIDTFDRRWRAVGAAGGPSTHNGELGLPGDVPNRWSREIDFG